MSRAEIIEEIRRLPEGEQRDLVKQIWREFGLSDGVRDDLSPEQMAELDRRLDEFESNPGEGTSWNAVEDNIQKRFGWKVT